MILLVERAHKRDERGGRGSRFSFSFSSQTKHQPLRLVGEPFHAGRKFSLSLPPYGYFVRSWSPFLESPLSYLKTVLRFTFKIGMIKDMY